MTRTASPARQSAEARRHLHVVRLESESTGAPMHEAYEQAEEQAEMTRPMMIAALKARIAKGEYRPSLDLIAERMLASMY